MARKIRAKGSKTPRGKILETLDNPSCYADLPLHQTEQWHALYQRSRVRVYTDISQHPEDTAAIVGQPLTVDPDQHRVNLAEIQRVAVIDSPVPHYPESPHSVSLALKYLVTYHPHLVPLPTIETVLARCQAEGIDGAHERTCLRALRTLREIARVHPRTCAGFLPTVEPYLTDSALPPEAIDIIVSILGEVEDIEAYDIRPVVTQHLYRYLRKDGTANATRGEEDDRHPATGAPVAGTLAAIATDDSTATDTRRRAIASLGMCVPDRPDVVQAHMDDFAMLLRHEDRILRVNASGLLCDLASECPEIVAAHVGDLEPLLGARDEHVRKNVARALSRVGGTSPDAIGHLLDEFVHLLDDDVDTVREQACLALGHIGSTLAVQPLRRVTAEDENNAVRAAASDAIDQIETGTLEE